MATTFKISVDLGAILGVGAVMHAGIFPRLAAAVERVTMAGAERWKDSVLHARLWDGERRAYADSIQWRMTGAYTGEIVSDYKYVEDIETGRPARDLKKMLDTSMKVRVSKKGRRYLIIPFRHNTPGNTALAPAMPQHIYDQAKDLSPSRIIGHGKRVSGTGAWDIKTRAPYLVRSRNYQWGNSLPAGLAPKLKPHHVTDIYAGTYRFDNKTPGGGRYSSYMTFRVMAEGSKGWIVPAQPGLFLAKTVTLELQPLAEKAFSEAIRLDTTI